MSFAEDRKEMIKQSANLQKAGPEIMKSFGGLAGTVMKDGALPLKEKELIALGIAIADRCENCILWHSAGAVKAGATREEIVETIGVAILMGGGPSSAYGAKALASADEVFASQK